VTPDYAQIGSGVTTRAKTVKEATEANSKLMAAIINALLESGVAQRDVQTSRFSIQPIYAPQEPRDEPKLAGYMRLQPSQAENSAGSTRLARFSTVWSQREQLDIGNVEFLVSEPSKALDQAREAAIADARRKAEVYARASGIKLGRVEWITEDSGFAPPVPMRAQGRIGCDGSTSANRQRRGHIASEGHGWFRRCPLIAIRACGDDGEQDEVANPSDIRCTKKPLRFLPILNEQNQSLVRTHQARLLSLARSTMPSSTTLFSNNRKVQRARPWAAWNRPRQSAWPPSRRQNPSNGRHRARLAAQHGLEAFFHQLFAHPVNHGWAGFQSFDDPVVAPPFASFRDIGPSTRSAP